MQREKLLAAFVRVGNIALNVFHGQNGQTGRHLAENRHLLCGRCAYNVNGAIQTRIACDIAERLQRFQVGMHRRGGAQTGRRADLTHRGRHGTFRHGGAKIVIYKLLAFR